MEISFVPKNPLLRDYFLSIFNSNDKTVFISKKHLVGFGMVTLWKKGGREKREQEIICRLPHCQETQQCATNFICFSNEAEIKINNLLQISFDVAFKECVLSGRAAFVPYVDIVHYFMKIHNLSDDNEYMFCKRIIRYRKDTLGARGKILFNKIHNIVSEANTTYKF